MSNLNINSKEFFSNYIFHPRDPSLSKGDSRKALIASVVLGILSLGIVYLVCLIKYRNVKHILQPTGTTATVNNLRPGRPSLVIVPPYLVVMGNLKRFDDFKLIANQPDKNFDKNAACRELARMYQEGVNDGPDGDNIEKNLDEAIKWLKKGIEADDMPITLSARGQPASGNWRGTSASDILADIYLANPDIAPEADELYKLAKGINHYTLRRSNLMEMAGEKGSANAMFEVGRNYLFGNLGAYDKHFGIKADPDLEKAMKWLTQAADNNNGFACVQLAKIYLFGHGGQVTVDKEEAGKLLIKAFDLGETNIILSYTIFSNNFPDGYLRDVKLRNKAEAIRYMRTTWGVDLSSH